MLDLERQKPMALYDKTEKALVIELNPAEASWLIATLAEQLAKGGGPTFSVSLSPFDPKDPVPSFHLAIYTATRK